MAEPSALTNPPSPTDSKPILPSAFSLFGPSWKAVRLNLVTLIEILAIPLMVSLILDTAGRSGHDTVLAPISDIIAFLFAPGLIITQLKSVEGKTIDLLPALKAGLPYFWRYLGLAICMGVVILLGLVLFIVPGLIMLRRYFLAPYYLIDKDLGIFEAMRMSAAETKPVSMAVWGVIGVSVLFGLLSFVLVGIVLSVMYYCAPALRYKQIASATKDAIPTTPANPIS